MVVTSKQARTTMMNKAFRIKDRMTRSQYIDLVEKFRSILNPYFIGNEIEGPIVENNNELWCLNLARNTK